MPYQYKKRNSWLLNPSFQKLYAFKLMVFLSLPLCIGLAIAYHFLTQNFEIFLEMAYRYSPHLLTHLEREKKIIEVVFWGLGIGSVVFVFLFGILSSYRMIGPIYALKKHLSNLTRGDWSQPELHTRTSDEYQDVVEVYNYFYRSLRRQSQWELEQLKHIQVPKYALESKERLSTLVNYKAEQLSEDSEMPNLDSQWDESNSA